MKPEDRYHFEPLLMGVESAIERGETTGSYFHSEIRRLLGAAFDCGDHYIAGYKAAQGAISPDDMGPTVYDEIRQRLDEYDRTTRHSQSCPQAFAVFRAIVDEVERL